MPVGKHPDARMRNQTNAEKHYDEMVAPADVGPPDPDPKWDPIAIRMYSSFIGSPQERWFLASDWALIWTLCENLSRDLKPQFVGFAEVWNAEAQAMEKKPVRTRLAIKGTSMAQYLRGYGNVLATIADRRALKFEVSKPKPGEVGADGEPASPSLELLEGGLTG